jgi:hypothetical protein
MTLTFDLESLQSTVEDESIAAVADRLRLPRATIASAIKGMEMSDHVVAVLAVEFPVTPPPHAEEKHEQSVLRMHAMADQKAELLRRFNSRKYAIHQQIAVRRDQNERGVAYMQELKRTREAKREAAGVDMIQATDARFIMEHLGITSIHRLAYLADVQMKYAREWYDGKLVLGVPGRKLKTFKTQAMQCLEEGSSFVKENKDFWER